MALVLGTNCGFCAVAPSSNPSGASGYTADNNARALKVTSPAGAVKITEIGWWCRDATEETDFELGIYDHHSGTDLPDALIAKTAPTAKGTIGGVWKSVAVDWEIEGNTIYWIALQVDNTPSNTKWDGTNTGGQRDSSKWGETTLLASWGTSDGTYANLLSIYVVYEEGEPENINPKVKVSGTFATKTTSVKIGGTFAEKPVLVKVSGTFQ